MASVNKVILIGNLGKDPEIRTTPAGHRACALLARDHHRLEGRSGAQQERTEWHDIVAWEKLAQICGEYLQKGKRSTSRAASRPEAGRTRTARSATRRRSRRPTS